MGVEKQVLLPDIGDFENVDVIEILVSVGDRVEVDDSLIVLESDKATMEIPSPFAGVVREIHVAAGDQVSQGALIAILEVEEAEALETAAPPEPELPGDSSAPSSQLPASPRPSTPFRSQLPASPKPFPPFPPARRPAGEPTPAPRCADWPASSASTFGWCRPPVARDGSRRRTSRAT